MVEKHTICLKFSQKKIFWTEREKEKYTLTCKCSPYFQKNYKESECIYTPKKKKC